MSFLQLSLKSGKSGSNTLPDFRISAIDGYYIVGSPQNSLVKLRMRDDYPRTYAYQLDDKTVVLGYGPQDAQPSDEFLQIILDDHGNVAVRRDTYATLPLFYGKTTDTFVLSNDYRFVVNTLPIVTRNQTALLDTLIPEPDAHTALWNEIGILDERQVLELNDHGLTVHQPEARQWASSRQVGKSDPKLFKSVLTDRLETFIDSFAKEEGFAFEVSGGIDSATLPLYYAKTYPYGSRPSLGSMVFPGDFGVTQIEKLRSLAEATGFSASLITVDPETDYPLARMLGSNRLYAHYCFDEIYSEALEKLAVHLAEQNVRIVATGIGGDELFENTLSAGHQLHYGDSERRRREKMRYPPFVTTKTREAYLQAVPSGGSYPLPLLGVSLHGAQISRNNIYISHDIWPVSPFADSEFYRYCQGLPAHFRANKNILRAFHAAYEFPEVIYNPTQNEHFGLFFDESLSSGKYDNIVETLAERSVTNELGFIDTQILLQTYQAYRCAPNSTDKKGLFYVFAWLNAEINLQLTRYKVDLSITASAATSQ